MLSVSVFIWCVAVCSGVLVVKKLFYLKWDYTRFLTRTVLSIIFIIMKKTVFTEKNSNFKLFDEMKIVCVIHNGIQTPIGRVSFFSFLDN